MSAGSFSVAAVVVGTFLTAVAVKVLDDFLDAAPEDRPVWSFPYGAAALAVAGAVAPQVAAVLFLSSYAAGMFGRPGERMPSGLPAWVESMIAVGLGVAVAGWRVAGTALAAVLAVQCWDDFMDARRDGMAGQANLATRFGRVEVAAAGTALGAAAALGDAVLLSAVIASAGLIWIWEWAARRRRAGGGRHLPLKGVGP